MYEHRLRLSLCQTSRNSQVLPERRAICGGGGSTSVVADSVTGQLHRFHHPHREKASTFHRRHSSHFPPSVIPPRTTDGSRLTFRRGHSSHSPPIARIRVVSSVRNCIHGAYAGTTTADGMAGIRLSVPTARRGGAQGDRSGLRCGNRPGGSVGWKDDDLAVSFDPDRVPPELKPESAAGTSRSRRR